jgi:hypothetical protein
MEVSVYLLVLSTTPQARAAQELIALFEVTGQIT